MKIASLLINIILCYLIPGRSDFYSLAYIQRKGVGTLAYYLVEALLLLRVLDCPPYVISKAHTKIVYSAPKGKYMTMVWAFLLIIHTVELSRFQQGIILLNALSFICSFNSLTH